MLMIMLRIGYTIVVLYALATQDMYLCYALLIMSIALVSVLRIPKLTRQQRLRRNGGKHTELEWRLMQFYYGNRCAACGKRSAKLTKDHRVPVSKGGTDNIENIQPLCQSCNSKKGAKHVTY